LDSVGQHVPSDTGQAVEDLGLIEMKYKFSEDKSLLDFSTIVGFISETPWGKGRTTEGIERAVKASYCVGGYSERKQVGFARAVSDTVYHAAIFDVFVLSDHRNRGIGTELVRRILAHSALKDVKNWYLCSREYDALYEKFGFQKYSGAAIMNARAAVIQSREIMLAKPL
jgi:N-acetylglutamate synthase-like GNAT family acetyltransferase